MADLKEQPMQISRVPERLKNCVLLASQFDTADASHIDDAQRLAGNAMLALIDLVASYVERDPEMPLAKFLDLLKSEWPNYWCDVAEYAAEKERAAVDAAIEAEVAVEVKP